MKNEDLSILRCQLEEIQAEEKRHIALIKEKSRLESLEIKQKMRPLVLQERKKEWESFLLDGLKELEEMSWDKIWVFRDDSGAQMTTVERLVELPKVGLVKAFFELSTEYYTHSGETISRLQLTLCMRTKTNKANRELLYSNAQSSRAASGSDLKLDMINNFEKWKERVRSGDMMPSLSNTMKTVFL